MTILDELEGIETLACEDEQRIIECFVDRYDVTLEEATEIFKETKKWLWLAAQNEDESMFIDRPLLILDEMWHTFILHTRQYYNFCINNFKKLVHHNPTPPSEKKVLEKELKDNPSEVISKHQQRVEKQYSVIYDKLGPETLLKWYDTIAQKYTPEYIQSIRRV